MTSDRTGTPNGRDQPPDTEVTPDAEPRGGGSGGVVGSGRFLETPLWRESLAARQGRDPHRSERAQLRESYLGLRERVTPLLSALSEHSTAPGQDVAHVDGLWETASLVCGDTAELSPVEVYVLGGAFVFHLAVMGVACSREVENLVGPDRWRDLVAHRLFDTTGQWPDSAQIEDPPAEVRRGCALEAARQLTARQVVGHVEQRWQNMPGSGRDLIEPPELREAYGSLIARVAWSHWWDIDRLLVEFPHTQGSPPWLPLDWSVDPLRLACILRAADATQLSSRRPPSFLAALGDTCGDPPWGFQEQMARPLLESGQLVYTMLRPFDRTQAQAWWSGLEYLQQVNHELRGIDALLEGSRRPRLAARGIAYVDSPERFGSMFPVSGWRPIDAKVRISDARRHIGALTDGLWERPTPEVALRELLRNAQDAVTARRVLDPAFGAGEIVVTLGRVEEAWTLEVRDHGVGMCEDLILDGLLDVGRSGWVTAAARTAFPGLTARGFRPAGTSGMGFYAVFTLGDHVTVTSRRYDLGPDSARQLIFSEGLRARPLLCALQPDEPPAYQGTVVEVTLNTNPTEPEGLLATTTGGLAALIQRLLPGSSVPVTVNDHVDGRPSGSPCPTSSALGADLSPVAHLVRS